jgi:hypothetical protein
MGNGVGQASRLVARKGDFRPNSKKIKRARCAVWHPTVHTIEENRSGRSEPTPGILRSVLCASVFLPSKSHSIPLAVSGDRTHTSTPSIHPMWRDNKDGEPPLQEECMAFVHR